MTEIFKKYGFDIWDGVYDDFVQVPKCGEGFESKRWTEATYAKTKKCLSLLKKDDFTNPNTKGNLTPFSIVSSIIYAKKKSLKVLDFGGGMGLSFLELSSVLPKNKNLTYVIVENNQVNTKSKDIYKKNKKIKFTNVLPKNYNFDIVYMSSVLQFVENWQELIDTLAKYNAKYFIFNDLPSGNIESTYASAQNHYESKIPCWFFKLDEIVNKMKFNGYEVIFKSNLF